jgi:hypothetical protein
MKYILWEGIPAIIPFFGFVVFTAENGFIASASLYKEEVGEV